MMAWIRVQSLLSLKSQSTKSDTIEILQERVKTVEHQLYPQVISDFAAGRFWLESGRIIWEKS